MVLTAPVAEAESLAAAQRSLATQQIPGLDVVVVPWGPTADVATGNGARNAGARAATGDHLYFLDHRTRLRPGALARLIETGNQSRGYQVVRAAGDRGPLDPASYLFSAGYWADSALGFDETHGDFPDAACARAAAGRPVEVDGQLWDRVGTEPGVMPSWAGSLEAWLTMVPAVRQMVLGQEKAQWIRELLVGDVPGLLADAERLTHERLPYLADTVGTLLAALPTRDLARVPVEARAAAWLGGQAHWSELAELLAGRLQQEGHFPTRVEGTRVYADLPGVDWAALRTPQPMLEVGLDETGMTCSVRRVRWVEGADGGAGVSLAVDLFVGVRHVALADPLVQARWVSSTGSVVAAVERKPDLLARLSGERHHDQSDGSVTVDTPPARLSRGSWRLELAITQGEIVRLGRPRNRDTSGSAGELRPSPDGSAQPVWGSDGLRLLVAPGGTFERPPVRSPRVTGVRLEGGSLVVDTRAPVRGTPVLASQAGAARGTAEGTAEGSTLRFRLRADRFGTGERPAPSGRYRLLLGDRPVPWDPTALDDVAFDLRADDHRIGVQRSSSGAVVIALRPPLRDDEVGGFAQQQLLAAYDATQPLADQVLLESVAGRACTGSPLAIDLELARTRPDLPRLWVVEDHAVVVPAGAQAVLRHSREWYSALATSRWVFLDGELPGFFDRREGQQVVQTLAGHPVRVLGVEEWEQLNHSPRRIEHQLGRGAGQWSTLLVPNARLEPRFRSSFRYDGEVLPAGLPRADLLTRPGGDSRRAHTRAALGVGSDQTVVLHAPEPRSAAGASALDVPELCRRLGPGHTVLLRDAGPAPVPDDVPGSRIIDVTDHPQVADLMLAADCLVTDHSALLFDFALLCRPMVFHLPDGGGDERGFWHPWAETTPGPVCATTEEVAGQLLDLDGVSRRYASALAELNAGFNDMCDGHAAERVVASTVGSGSGSGRLPPAPGDRMAGSR